MQQLLEQIQGITDPYDRLQKILELSDEKTVKSLQEKFNVDHDFCINGIICAMESCHKLDFRPVQGVPSWMLEKKLGFSDDQTRRKHMCTEPNCTYVSDLGNLLNHMIGYHKLPLIHLSKTIPVFKSDTRPIPKGIRGFVNRMVNMHKSAD